MFSGWLKGILGSALFIIAFLFFFYGVSIYEEDSTGGLIGIVIGLILGGAGSYLKYVSRQTVKTKK